MCDQDVCDEDICDENVCDENVCGDLGAVYVAGVGAATSHCTWSCTQNWW